MTRESTLTEWKSEIGRRKSGGRRVMGTMIWINRQYSRWGRWYRVLVGFDGAPTSVGSINTSSYGNVYAASPSVYARSHARCTISCARTSGRFVSSGNDPPATATATTDTDRFLRCQIVIADLSVWGGGGWSCSKSKEVLSCASLCTLYIRCPVRQMDSFRMRTIPQPRPASQDVSRSAFLASFVTVTDNM